jgi:DNA-binding NarL/FixJ family response regulator
VLMATQILLADGHEGLRKLIRKVIGQRSDWHVCAEASDGLEAVEKAKSFCPDLALLAIGLPGLGGLHAAQKILDACPQTIVIADSLHDPLPLLAEIKKVGIRAFVSKTRIGTDLVPAIEAVLAGKTWVNLEDSNRCLSLEEAIQGARRMVWAPDPTFEGFSCSNCRWRISTEDAGNLKNIEQSFAGHTCTDYPSRAKAAGI